MRRTLSDLMTNMDENSLCLKSYFKECLILDNGYHCNFSVVIEKSIYDVCSNQKNPVIVQFLTFLDQTMWIKHFASHYWSNKRIKSGFVLRKNKQLTLVIEKYLLKT